MPPITESFSLHEKPFARATPRRCAARRSSLSGRRGAFGTPSFARRARPTSPRFLVGDAVDHHAFAAAPPGPVRTSRPARGFRCAATSPSAGRRYGAGLGEGAAGGRRGARRAPFASVADRSRPDGLAARCGRRGEEASMVGGIQTDRPRFGLRIPPHRYCSADARASQRAVRTPARRCGWDHPSRRSPPGTVASRRSARGRPRTGRTPPRSATRTHRRARARDTRRLSPRPGPASGRRVFVKKYRYTDSVCAPRKARSTTPTLALAALEGAVRVRKPPPGLLHQSDRGSPTRARGIAQPWRVTRCGRA